jgi:hypothetical protein
VQQKINYRFEKETEKVKRWSKSPPLGWRQTRHGKPYGLKDQISADFRATRSNSSFEDIGMGRLIEFSGDVETR